MEHSLLHVRDTLDSHLDSDSSRLGDSKEGLLL